MVMRTTSLRGPKVNNGRSWQQPSGDSISNLSALRCGRRISILEVTDTEYPDGI